NGHPAPRLEDTGPASAPAAPPPRPRFERDRAPARGRDAITPSATNDRRVDAVHRDDLAGARRRRSQGADRRRRGGDGLPAELHAPLRATTGGLPGVEAAERRDQSG